MDSNKFRITQIKVEHQGLSEIRTYRQTDFIVKADPQSAVLSSYEEDPLSTLIKDEPLDIEEHDISNSDVEPINNAVLILSHESTNDSMEDPTDGPSKRRSRRANKSKPIEPSETDDSMSDDPADSGFETLLLMDDDKSEKRLQCLMCPRSFRYPSEMARHQLTHSNERPFKCDKCPRSFNRSSNLVAHRRIHSEERPYQCGECDKRFAQRNGLKAHTKLHTGKKPYQCDLCGKTFMQYANLTVHRRSHTGERPYQCDECGKTFTQVANLVAHRRLHTGEKPFQCEECKKTFTLHAHLISHRRVHSKDRPFRCDVCGLSFYVESRLLVHRRTHVFESNKEPAEEKLGTI